MIKIEERLIDGYKQNVVLYRGFVFSFLCMKFLPSLSRYSYPAILSEHIVDLITEHGSQMKDQLYELKAKIVYYFILFRITGTGTVLSC